MLIQSVCYQGMLGGPRSMGKVGAALVDHLVRKGYRTYFWPWDNDYMRGYWPEEVDRLVIESPEGLEVDQSLTFGSVLSARQRHWARQTVVWLYHELNRVPPNLVEEINSNDHVYATSSFVRQVFLAHGVRVPVSVLAHGIYPQDYPFVARRREGEFVFLCVAEATSRKNLPMLVDCFEKAFAGRKDVRLILKVGIHSADTLQEQIGRSDRVTLDTRLLPAERDLAELYGRAHAFVLPTRGEGFGMPVLEALATGLPVIVTGYSGPLDFCTAENSYLLGIRGLVDSDPGCFPHLPGQWADPDPDHLIHLMRHVYENYDEALHKGAVASRMVHTAWTWEQQLSRIYPGTGHR